LINPVFLNLLSTSSNLRPPTSFQPSPSKTFKTMTSTTASFTASTAFRLLSAPSGTYNKAPPGLVAAGIPTLARGALGAFSLPGAEDFPRPSAAAAAAAAPLSLYEFQACPFCKKVREALTLLALDVVFYPCPKNGVAFRPLAAEMAQAAGKARPQFPVLVAGGGQGQGQVPLFESDEIVKTLFEKFGPPEKKEAIPWQLRPGNFFGKVSLALSAAPRAASGRAAAFTFAEDEAGRAAAQEFAESRRALKPLTLWGYEPSPYVALVREKLTELVRSFFVCLFVCCCSL
jgi:glutaredoxin